MLRGPLLLILTLVHKQAYESDVLQEAHQSLNYHIINILDELGCLAWVENSQASRH